MKHEANLFLSNNGSHKSALLLKWSKRCRFSVGVWLKDHWCGVFITLSSVLKQEVLRFLLLLRPLTWNLIEKRQFLITIKLQADLIWKYSLIPLNTAYAHRIFHCRLTSNIDLKTRWTQFVQECTLSSVQSYEVVYFRVFQSQRRPFLILKRSIKLK